MANARSGNKIFIDSTGPAVQATQIKVAYVVFTPDSADAQLTLRESSTGPNCLVVKAATAKDTVLLDFSSFPLIFNNAVYVHNLTSGATATLITTSAGADQ